MAIRPSEPLVQGFHRFQLWKNAGAGEPSPVLDRQMITGGLHCPDSAQRHQATFSLAALFASWGGLFRRRWN
jgi:hypothetical protein